MTSSTRYSFKRIASSQKVTAWGVSTPDACRTGKSNQRPPNSSSHIRAMISPPGGGRTSDTLLWSDWDIIFTRSGELSDVRKRSLTCQRGMDGIRNDGIRHLYCTDTASQHKAQTAIAYLFIALAGLQNRLRCDVGGKGDGQSG